MENKSNKQRKQERFDDNLAHWIAYWRANPHRFVTEYLMNTNGLFLFQKILIYFMFKSDLFLFIAARGLGKSFLTSIFATAYSILYPGTKICIISASKNQSQLIISSKIKAELADRYPAIAREILEIKTGLNDSSVKFKNGSFITVVVGNDNARGYLIAS